MSQVENRQYLQAIESNYAFFDGMSSTEYADMSPHISHPDMHKLYVDLVDVVFANSGLAQPMVLDLGAGEGSATIEFLKRGARVTAIDSSPSQLAHLHSKCGVFADRLTIVNEEVFAAIAGIERAFDIVVASSFLHHVPDYLTLIEGASRVLRRDGQLFFFQDPLRYDSMSRIQYWFSTFSYLCWRAKRPDRIAGLKRRLRRARGIYSDPVFDNGEYHVTRNGVDQDAIVARLQSLSFRCEVIRYFSTQSRFFQRLGVRLGMENTFAIIARRQES